MLLCLSFQEEHKLFFRFVPSDVDEVVASLDGCKSSGLDDFNFYFYKKFWDLLKVEIYGMFD